MVVVVIMSCCVKIRDGSSLALLQPPRCSWFRQEYHFCCTRKISRWQRQMLNISLKMESKSHRGPHKTGTQQTEMEIPAPSRASTKYKRKRTPADGTLERTTSFFKKIGMSSAFACDHIQFHLIS